MFKRNILFACLLSCSIICAQSKKRDPFHCAHKHGAFHVIQIEQESQKSAQEKEAPSGWQIIEQKGSEVIMQDSQGHIRKISLAS